MPLLSEPAITRLPLHRVMIYFSTFPLRALPSIFPSLASASMALLFPIVPMIIFASFDFSGVTVTFASTTAFKSLMRFFAANCTATLSLSLTTMLNVSPFLQSIKSPLSKDTNVSAAETPDIDSINVNTIAAIFFINLTLPIDILFQNLILV